MENEQSINQEEELLKELIINNAPLKMVHGLGELSDEEYIRLRDLVVQIESDREPPVDTNAVAKAWEEAGVTLEIGVDVRGNRIKRGNPI